MVEDQLERGPAEGAEVRASDSWSTLGSLPVQAVEERSKQRDLGALRADLSPTSPHGRAQRYEAIVMQPNPRVMRVYPHAAAVGYA